jgi:hypothetical protein
VRRLDSIAFVPPCNTGVGILNIATKVSASSVHPKSSDLSNTHDKRGSMGSSTISIPMVGVSSTSPEIAPKLYKCSNALANASAGGGEMNLNRRTF